MKRLPHLTAILAAVMLSFGATAQDFPIPYNPDDDANGLIGTPDLLSLLALFGEEFSAAVVAENQESAVTFLGDLNYFNCDFSCKQLPGMWRMAASTDLALVLADLNIESYTYTWLHKDEFSMAWDKYPFYRGHTGTQYNGDAQLQETARPMQLLRCYCSIKEIPKVEYFTCTASCSEITELDACVNEKLAEGWQLHDSQRQQQVSSICFWQPLWRWAE